MVTRIHETDVDRLARNIRDELAAQNAMLRLGLDGDLLDDLAEQIAVNIDYGFECRWAPRWVKDGDPHHWSEEVDGVERFFSECITCGWLTSSTEGSDAVEAEYRRHWANEHAAT